MTPCPVTAEVRLQRVREWQRQRAGSRVGGRRPSLPSDAVLLWFLASNGWALDKRGRAVLACDGRIGTLDPKWVSRRWFEFAHTYDLLHVPKRYVEAAEWAALRRSVGTA